MASDAVMAVQQAEGREGRLGARRGEEETDTAATAENRGRKKERKGSESHCRHFFVQVDRTRLELE